MPTVTELMPFVGIRFAEALEKLKNAGVETRLETGRGVADVRRYVREGWPVLISFDETNRLVVGEDEGVLVLAQPSLNEAGLQHVQISDDAVAAAMGDTIIVITGDRGVESTPVPERENVIFEPDRDKIEDESVCNRLEYYREKIRAFDGLGPCMVPAHPLIVCFHSPGEKEKKEKIRSMLFGVYIYIYDLSDVVSEFLHEAGHMYWRTRLNDMEKQAFTNMCTELHGRRDKSELPRVLVDDWGWRDGEELFCTCYMWYVRGHMDKIGYACILKVQYPDAHECLRRVFERVGMEIATAEAWQRHHRQIRKWFRVVFGTSTAFRAGTNTLKARVIADTVPVLPPLRLPADFQAQVLHEYSGRKWVRPSQGLFKARVFVVDAGADVVDWQYMRAHAQNPERVPVRKAYRDSRGRVRSKVKYVELEGVEFGLD